MAIVNFPYRWLPSTIFKNLRHAWRDITGGIKNLIKWAPVVWEDRWYDSDYLVRLLEFKLRDMADRFERQGCTVGSERYARQMKICATLCKRMQEDNYGFDKNGDLNPYFAKNNSWLRGKSRDAKYLGIIWGKYLSFWWD